MTIEVRFLDTARQEDFFRLHCPKNGAGWCSCVAWWVPTSVDGPESVFQRDA